MLEVVKLVMETGVKVVTAAETKAAVKPAVAGTAMRAKAAETVMAETVVAETAVGWQGRQMEKEVREWGGVETERGGWGRVSAAVARAPEIVLKHWAGAAMVPAAATVVVAKVVVRTVTAAWVVEAIAWVLNEEGRSGT